MTLQTILPLNLEALKSLSQQKNEPAWLTENRLKALELASKLELPKPEKTKIDKWDLSDYGTYQAPVKVATLDELPPLISALVEGNESDNLIVQKDSGAIFSSLSDELKAQGVIFTDLETAAREHEELVKPYLTTVVAPDEHQLTALNAAMWNGGAFLYVPKNVEVNIPVQAIFLTENAGATFAPRILVVADTNSSVTYVDNYISSGDDVRVHNGVVEIVAKAGAKVRYATVHQFGGSTTDMSYRRAITENDASIEWIIGEMNDGNTVTDTATVLKGNGSTSDAKIIAVGSGSQRLNYTTKAVHFGKDTTSQMITRAVMRESANAIINGITKIEHGATRSNGEQTEKVLMLSPKARGDANPILLIDEDDVMAGHAASVGQVNPEQVHYLMSRGITRPEAERLIIYGFLAPVVSDIPLERLQTRLQELVERKLGQ
ncbi:FeS cluster assembly protein SufD [Paenibacillus nuruki]|uniref:FeS cluster assembly protein SufD n=1 Tax=Paenibacillus nuruki TaxID=1886670 RepID=A0A1E3L779_9BACL|nr:MULTISPECIES: Fe-S cluster assembly protein SufD [Paenibacillus]ODP29015.1 FeS cluster assembly protein SufD [Paenibacillus nuruki]TKJ92213.1 Fe-S cluster assembly protein SufD [Paenibacillus sp. CFBP13512]CAJ1315968.1 Fe-S cluster assembly protein SufD [Paenibacillus nuruki]